MGVAGERRGAERSTLDEVRWETYRLTWTHSGVNLFARIVISADVIEAAIDDDESS